MLQSATLRGQLMNPFSNSIAVNRGLGAGSADRVEVVIAA